MPIPLQGKPIAITGASSGIGAATALACAAAGMPVALGARRTEKLDQIVGRIRASGGKAIALKTDVTIPDDCRRLVDATVEEFGSIYSVYANAGYGAELAVHEMSDRQMRDIFETNFFGTLNTIRPALDRMLEAGHTPGSKWRGHILICSSCLAKMTVPYHAAYSATKAAQAHISRAMNLELRPKGVYVSSINPIGTRTEFSERLVEHSGGIQPIAHMPQPLKQTAEYVAALTVFCLRRPRAEVWTGPRGAFVRFGMSVCTLSPRIADLSLRGMVKRRLAAYGRPPDQSHPDPDVVREAKPAGITSPASPPA